MRISLSSILLCSFLQPVFGQERSDASVAGRWEWHGTGGWQRLLLDIERDGTKVSGTVSMGPAETDAALRSEFWQYFFEPAVFEIEEGRIEGNEIEFEHFVNGGEILRYWGTIEGDSMILTRESGLTRDGPVTSRFEATLERER
jgi:hypothetical protein